MSCVPAELQRAVIDAESNQIINGNGANLLGILDQGGTLTRAMGSDWMR